MNIDFANQPGFSAYVLLLMFSGIVMVVLATPKVRSSTWLRVLNVVLGLGFFGYGFYLAFLFQGGTYFMFFKAFIVPIVLVIRTVQTSTASRRTTPATVPYGGEREAGPEQVQPQPQS